MTPSRRLACTLVDLERLARSEFGGLAPSYPTLKRWAKSGRLEAALLPQETGRALYQSDLALSVIGQYLRRSESPNESPSPAAAAPAPGAPAAPSSSPESLPITQISSEVQELRARVESLTAAVMEVAAYARDLAEARKMLMVKTDNEITMWRDRAIKAEEAAAKLQGRPLQEARAQRMFRSGILDYDEE